MREFSTDVQIFRLCSALRSDCKHRYGLQLTGLNFIVPVCSDAPEDARLLGTRQAWTPCRPPSPSPASNASNLKRRGLQEQTRHTYDELA